MATSSNRQDKHSYMPLDSVKANTKVDVYGVVKFVKKPFKSKGSDYFMMLSITDSSFDDAEQKLKCLIFGKDESRLPVSRVGDIIRFHRLSVSRYRGELQGQSSPGLAWLIFSGDPGEPTEPVKSSSPNYSLSDTDRDKVIELRGWATGQGVSGKVCTFSTISVGAYFDLLCQVVCTCVIEDGVCLLLRVWDGTQTAHCVRQLDTSMETVDKDDRLAILARPFLYDVCLFDDHCVTAKDIKPGNYIKLCNLHAAEHKVASQASDLPSTSQAGAGPTVELVLHSGTAYGRCVKLLPADSPELVTLKSNLDKVTSTFAVFTDSEIQDINIMSDSQDVQIDDSSPNTSMVADIHRGDNRVHSTIGRGDNHDTAVRGDNHVHTAVDREVDTQAGAAHRCVNNVTKGQNPVSAKGGNKENVKKNPSVKRVIGWTSPHHSELAKKRIRADTDVIVITDSESGDNSGKTITHTGDRTNNRDSVGDADKTDVVVISSESRENSDKTSTSDDRTDNSGSVGDASKANTVVISSESGDKSTNISTNTSGGEARCMMETKTVIHNHPHIKPSTISNILKHYVPYKFRLRARVYDYHPKPDSTRSFIQLYCADCHYLCSMPDSDKNREDGRESQLSIGSTFKGLPHYNCPRCLANKDSLQGLESPPHLHYIFMLRFLLRDDTGWLMANIWKDDAERFFQDIQPEEVLQNDDLLTSIRQDLAALCPPASDIADRPVMECCIKSYSVADGTGFQIFDTSIA